MKYEHNFAAMPKKEVQARLRQAQIDLDNAKGFKRLAVEAVIRAAAAELSFRWKYRA